MRYNLTRIQVELLFNYKTLRKWTNKELAKAIGISPGLLGKIFRFKNRCFLNTSSFEKLEKFLMVCKDKQLTLKPISSGTETVQCVKRVAFLEYVEKMLLVHPKNRYKVLNFLKLLEK